MATQDQTLRTNTIKTIDEQNVPAECRMAEKVMRQLAIWYWNAKKLAQKQNQCCREDKMVKMIQWDLFCMWNAGLWQGWQIHVLHELLLPVYMHESTNNNHDPQPVYESTNNKLLWDFKIQTDWTQQACIEWNRTEVPDYWCCLSIWHLKERELKLRTNQDLRWELKCVWKLFRVTVWFHAVIIGTMKKCYGSCIAFALLCSI